MRRQLTQLELDLCGLSLAIASLQLTVQRAVMIALRREDEAELLQQQRDEFDAIKQKIQRGEIIGNDAVET